MTTKIVPGVYYEEIRDDLVTIGRLPSGIIGMIGTAERGPINKPVRLKSWSDYMQVFGGWRDELTGPKSFLAAARQGADDIFFCRIAGATKEKASREFYQAGASKATLSIPTRAGGVGEYATITLQDTGASDLLLLTSKETGTSENDITVAVTDGASVGFSNVIITKPNFSTETYSNIKVKAGDPRDITTLINASSKLVKATALANDAVLDEVVTPQELTGGVDSGTNSIIVTAKQSGTSANDITVKIDHADTRGRVNVLITTGTTTELYQDVFIDGSGQHSLVAAINAASSLVNVEQIVAQGTGPDNNPHTIPATNIAGGTAATEAFTLTAKEFGKYGDSVLVTIENATSGGHNITILEGRTNTVLEQFLNVGEDDVVSTINGSSKVVDATIGTAGPLEAVKRASLLAGDNGASTTDSDYIGFVDSNGNRTGLYALAGERLIDIQVAAEQDSMPINQANVAICEEMGDRVAVLALPESSDLEHAISAASMIDSTVAVQAWPWKYAPHPVTGEDILISPAGLLAGTLAGGKINASPSNKAIRWAYRDMYEYSVASNEMERLVQARIIPSARKISTLDPTGRFVWMSGRTTSTSAFEKDQQISVIRPFINIVNGIVEGLDPYVSENNTPYLRASVRLSGESYLARFVKNGTLEKFSLKCDGTNNTDADARSGNLYVDISLWFYYPADRIIIRVKRDPAGLISVS